MTEELLIIFVKNPELGRVKTRLAATVGDEVALDIYKRLLDRTKQITSALPFDKTVFYDRILAGEDLWNSKGFTKDVQPEGDLGQRMSTAFQKSFEKGYKRICIIGSDCYELTTNILTDAFNALKSKNTVIGGAKDGGYYLVGMNQWLPEIFENKAWSTAEVYPSTIKDFIDLGKTFTELPKLNDIDREEDLGSWAYDLVSKK
uniref:TIGR04282 family arsenosugar biosynthesis glycosyltransferase n=1 Tax=Roseivirga sp. TaxID=1964215 RepID=UPI0040565875